MSAVERRGLGSLDGSRRVKEPTGRRLEHFIEKE